MEFSSVWRDDSYALMIIGWVSESKRTSVNGGSAVMVSSRIFSTVQSQNQNRLCHIHVACGAITTVVWVWFINTPVIRMRFGSLSDSRVRNFAKGISNLWHCIQYYLPTKRIWDCYRKANLSRSRQSKMLLHAGGQCKRQQICGASVVRKNMEIRHITEDRLNVLCSPRIVGDFGARSMDGEIEWWWRGKVSISRGECDGCRRVIEPTRVYVFSELDCVAV